MNDSTLLVVGAGAKAAAIASKARALEKFGWDVPKIVVLEKSDEAANWSGKHGYTDGRQLLGTPPEKDIGFPYDTSLFGDDVAEHMLAKNSWQAFQISERGYSDWVDRGRRHPPHGTWQRYLRWVLDRSECSVIRGSLSGLKIKGKTWQVQYQSPGNNNATIDACGVVLTGPGPALQLAKQAPVHALITDGASFWLNLDTMRSLVPDSEPVVVIGSGETAASVVMKLVEIIGDNLIPIVIVNRQGTIFSRGEGFFENRLFSDPSLWANIDLADRRTLMGRADRGVISVEAHMSLGGVPNIFHQTFDVETVVIEHELDGTEICVVHDRKGNRLSAQVVIIATGFDSWWFARFLPSAYRGYFETHSFRQLLETEILPDLSVPAKYLPAPLHVPMLSGIAQGPGFPNLSCLGHLSDHILKSYVTQ